MNIIITNKDQYRQHQVFVEFLGWWENTESISLAMEFFPLGDLRACDDGQISEDDARDICQQLLEGLEMMHEKGYAHRDLKPEVCTKFSNPPGHIRCVAYKVIIEHLRRSEEPILVGQNRRLWHLETCEVRWFYRPKNHNRDLRI